MSGKVDVNGLACCAGRARLPADCAAVTMSAPQRDSRRATFQPTKASAVRAGVLDA